MDIFTAVKKRDQEYIDEYLKSPQSLDVQDHNGMTPLMHAVDLNRATLKMEIPLGDLIPSYDSVRPYVHLITATPAPPPPPAIEAYARQGLILAHAR